MRNIYYCPLIMAIVVMFCVAGTATATDLCYSYGYTGFAWHTSSPYAAPACFAPNYGYPGVGCCPYPRSKRYDHIWDGYCQEGHDCQCCRRQCCGPLYYMPVMGTTCTPYESAPGSTSVVVEGKTVVEPRETTSPSPAPKADPEVQAPKPTKAPDGK